MHLTPKRPWLESSETSEIRGKCGNYSFGKTQGIY